MLRTGALHFISLSHYLLEMRKTPSSSSRPVGRGPVSGLLPVKQNSVPRRAVITSKATPSLKRQNASLNLRQSCLVPIGKSPEAAPTKTLNIVPSSKLASLGTPSSNSGSAKQQPAKDELAQSQDPS